MLYALCLQKTGELYGDPALCEKAESLRETIRKLSYNGEFFADHAVRQDGKLVQCRDTSEVCQYYAFFTETATPDSYPSLWEKLVTDFGPDRKKNKSVPCSLLCQRIYRELSAPDLVGAQRTERTAVGRNIRLFSVYGGKDGNAVGKRYRFCKL